jgi:hypothetical protein
MVRGDGITPHALVELSAAHRREEQRPVDVE